MNARSTALALAVVAAAAVGATWFFTTRSQRATDEGAAVALAPGAAERMAREEPEIEALAPDRVESAEEPARAEGAQPASERSAAVPEERSSADSDSGAIWIAGRVLLRHGTPLDEAIRVEARGKRFRPGDDGRSHFATADRDGRFRSAFAEGTHTGWIELDARYLYLEEKLQVDVDDAPDELLLEPKLGGLVRGRALAPHALGAEQPSFADTVASLTSWGGSAGYFRRVRPLDAEGRFEFGGVPPGTDYRIDVESKLYAKAEHSPVEVRPGEATDVELELDLGARVVGRVVGPDGAGVARANILVATKRGMDADNEQRSSEEDGSFDLGGLNPGEIALMVSREGFLEHGVELGLLAEGAVREGVVVTLETGGAIEGLVQWPDGRPAEGAWVQVAEEGNTGSGMAFLGSEEPSTKVGVDGRFRFTGLTGSSCTLRASARPEAEKDEDGRRRRGPAFIARIEGVRPGAKQLTLVLEVGDSVRGRVVDDAGEPVSRFRVAAEPVGEGGPLRSPVSSLFLALDGSFELSGLQEGEWELTAQSREHAHSSAESITVPYDGAHIELRLPRFARVAGRVVAPSGEPVSGARVMISAAGEQQRIFYGGDSGGEKTDDEGAFEDERVEPGRRRLVARADGYAESEPLVVTLAPAGEAADLLLALRREGRITGSVHPASGEIAGRSIQVSRREGNFHRTLSSDGEGRFQLDGLSPGTYSLTLQGPQSGDVGSEQDWMLRHAQRSEVTVELAEAASAHVVLGAPPEHAILVSGRVTENGQAVAGVPVTWDKRNVHAGARTADDGSYAVTLDGGGDWSVAVGARWNDRAIVHANVPEEESFRFDIALPTASIAGTVRGPAGEFATNCPVSLSGVAPEGSDGAGWRDVRNAMTDGEGRYSFRNLRAGTYTLQAGGAQQWMDEAIVHARRSFPPVAIGEGERREGFDLALETGGTIEGSVLGPAGEPVAGAWIQVRDAAGTDLFSWSSVHTDERGRFRVRGIAAGTVVVHAQGGEKKSDEREVRVQRDETVKVELVIAQ